MFQQYHSNLTKWGGARTVQCIAKWPMNLSAMGRSQKTWGGYNDSNIWFEHTQIMLGLGSDDIDLMKWLCASPVGSVGYERFLPRFAAIKYIICNIVLCVLNLCKPLKYPVLMKISKQKNILNQNNKDISKWYREIFCRLNISQLVSYCIH